MSVKDYIQIRQLKKSFRMGQTVVNALAGVDLDIEKGSFTVVMGPSGSGKSTMLYIVGGLDRASSGKVMVDGVSLDQMDENDLAVYRRKMVGFVFQSFNLVQSMNALENVGFPMQFNGISPRKRKEKAMELLKVVGLESRAHHKPSELSGGQQQRVAVARSLVNDPQLLVADEPTGNLDTSSGTGIMQILSDLHKQGKTVLVVTHDPRMRHYATQTIYLLDGKVVDEAAYETSTAAAFH
jgi:putative ABC transport system ATP-binding protein